VLDQAQSQASIVALMSRPAEKALPWHEYRARFLTERRIRAASRRAGCRRRRSRAPPSSACRCRCCCPSSAWRPFTARTPGRHRVIDALATLAFDYPPRSPFFRSELENFLLMSREESLDPLAPLGSYAGAMGIPQFMPSSFRNYAVDGDGDGRRNLWTSWADVFASVANYLREHGWRKDEPVMARADVTEAGPRRTRVRQTRAQRDRWLAARARRALRHGAAGRGRRGARGARRPATDPSTA